MPRAVVVLPSTTYRAADFINAAEALGVELIVVSEQLPPFDMGDRYLQIDCSDPDAAAEAIAGLGESVPIDGVVAADDGGVVIAALAGWKLGLSANDPNAARATRNKAELRHRLKKAEVPQPRYAVIEDDRTITDLAGLIGFPLVLKPTTRAASQGIIRADDQNELALAVDTLRNTAGIVETLLLEEYMPGDEVAVEGLVVDGELTVLAIFDKPDTSSGPYFPETIMVTPSRQPRQAQAEIERVAASAIRALGLTHGPVHVELMVDDTQVRVIEAAARSIGGLCSRSLSFGLMNTSLETLILRNALGMDKPELHREQQANAVLMIPIPKSGVLEAVTGLDSVKAIEGVTGVDITIPNGSKVQAPPIGDRYLGFVFARTRTPEEAESALRQAMSRIDVLVK